MTLALVFTLLAGWVCFHAVAGVVRQVPRYAEQVRGAAQKAQTRLKSIERHTKELTPAPSSQQQQGQESAPAQQDWGTLLLRGLGSIFEAAGLAVFVPFLALFLLIEQPVLESAMDRAAGPEYDASRLRDEGARLVRAYIFGNLVLGLVLALVQWGLFASLGLENAFSLGLATGYLNVVPVLGLPLALLLPLGQGLATFHGPLPFILLTAALLFIHLAAANWIIPRTIGARVKVNASAGTLGMLFFGWMWGVVGFLLAVPLMGLIKVALDCSPKTAAFSGLLAAEAPPPGRLRLWRRHGAAAGR